MTKGVGEVLDHVPRRSDVEVILWEGRLFQRADSHAKPALLAELSRPMARLDAVDLPSVSGRDFHEHAGIATDVEEPLAKGITHHLLDWAKVPLERQH